MLNCQKYQLIIKHFKEEIESLTDNKNQLTQFLKKQEAFINEIEQAVLEDPKTIEKIYMKAYNSGWNAGYECAEHDLLETT